MIDEVTVGLLPLDGTPGLPSYAHPGDAGLDLRAAEGCILAPFERAVVPCGFAMEIPEGYAGLVLPRSGLASRHGVTVANAPGLIDSGYRGQVAVALVNLDAQEAFEVAVGDRIAQLMIVRAPLVRLEERGELAPSVRGEGGFGSSGRR